jgi:bla regulator protein blaR1
MAIATLCACAIARGQAAGAQAVPDWVTAAGGHAEFDAASVREDPTGKYKGPPFSTDADDDFTNASGLFTADGPINGFIAFAYKLPQQYSMISHLPDWAKSKHFEITARAAAGTTKDQMRLMMQSLLAERFKLALHYETQETPVLVMTLMKPGTLGPRLRLHKDGPGCDVVTPRPPGATITFDMFPCNTYMAATDRPEVILSGARNTTSELMAAFFSSVGYKKPIMDRTGITGTIDFSMEYATPVRGSAPPSADAQAALPGATFEQAVKEQLGLKLEPAKAPLAIPVVDHVEMPSEN